MQVGLTRVLAKQVLTSPPFPAISSSGVSFPPPLPLFFHMNSMNSRFKGLGFGLRRSNSSIKGPDGQNQPSNQTPPLGQVPHQPPTPGQSPSLGASSSTTSLPMNHPGIGNHPPSYANNLQHGPVGRNSPLNQGPVRTPPSQMAGGPPPINTGAPVGYPPGIQHPGMGHGPPMGGPPPGFGAQTGYPPPGGPPGGGVAQQFQRGNPAAEVEGASKSKAQLIVGIDFVSCLRARTTSQAMHRLTR